jgi:hypothetical protein
VLVVRRPAAVIAAGHAINSEVRDPGTFYWDASAGAISYRIKWGSSPATYTNTQNVGNTTQWPLLNLSPPLVASTTYYLAVFAWDGVDESAPSNEIIVRDWTQVG